MTLDREFFARPTLEVARDLLGKLLVTRARGAATVGRIVEVEAYLGERDLASHAARGRTARNAPMFGPPGHAYVYLIYGMHHCLNIVTEPDGVAGAVLVRALEPVAGIERMRRRRGVADLRALASGPGKLCQALAITRAASGTALDGTAIGVVERWDGAAPAPPVSIALSPRIGVDYAGAWARKPYRFFVRGNPWVS